MNSTLSAATILYLLRMREGDQRTSVFGSILVLLPGGFMNIINIFVFSRKSFANNLRFFYIWLSVIDMISCFLFIPIFLPRPWNISNLTSVNCKVTSVFVRFLAFSSHWLQLMISFDRVMVTLFNSVYKSIYGNKYKWGSILLIFAAGFLNSLAHLTLNLRELPLIYENVTYFQRACVPPDNLGLAVNTSAFILRSVVPSIIMAIFNTILIYKIFWRKRKMNKLTQKDYKFAFTIIMLNFLFILFNMPMNITQIYDYIPIRSEEYRAFMFLLRRIFMFIIFMHQAYTMLFHLKFNSLYRKEFVDMMIEIKNKIKLETSSLLERNTST
jgi:hypothetical protein